MRSIWSFGRSRKHKMFGKRCYVLSSPSGSLFDTGQVGGDRSNPLLGYHHFGHTFWDMTFSYYDELFMVIHPILEILRMIWPSPNMFWPWHTNTHTWIQMVVRCQHKWPEYVFYGALNSSPRKQRKTPRRWMVQWKQYRTKFSPLPQVKDLVEEKTCKLADTTDFCALEIRFFRSGFYFSCRSHWSDVLIFLVWVQKQ